MEDALKKQKITGKIRSFLEEGLIDEIQLMKALEYQLKIPHIDLTTHQIDPEATKLISENLARRHMLIPVSRDEGLVTVAMADPLNLYMPLMM